MINFNIAPAFVTVLISVISSSCQDCPDNTISGTERGQLQNEVLEFVDKLTDVKGKKYDHFANFFAKTDGFLVAPNGSIATTDFDVAMDGVKSSNNILMSLNFHDPKIYVLDKNAATMTSLWDMTFINQNSDTLTYGGCWTYIFQKINNEWKIIQSIGTESEPQP